MPARGAGVFQACKRSAVSLRKQEALSGGAETSGFRKIDIKRTQ